MAVIPKKSKYDPNPYVPPAPPSETPLGWGPTNEPRQPPPPPPDGYAADPALSLAWTVPPDFTGNVIKPAGGSDGGGNKDANPHNPISANLPSFLATENQSLGILGQLVDGYTSLREQVLASLNTPGFFGENATYYHSWGVSFDGGQDQTLPDKNIQGLATTFDKNINPVMSRALRQIADTVTAAGQFTNLINVAGQLLSMADQASYLPPPTQATLVANGDFKHDDSDSKS